VCPTNCPNRMNVCVSGGEHSVGHRGCTPLPQPGLRDQPGKAPHVTPPDPLAAAVHRILQSQVHLPRSHFHPRAPPASLGSLPKSQRLRICRNHPRRSLAQSFTQVQGVRNTRHEYYVPGAARNTQDQRPAMSRPIPERLLQGDAIPASRVPGPPRKRRKILTKTLVRRGTF
jgi:hypothetical protein